MKQIVENKSVYEVPQHVVSVERIVFEGFTTTNEEDRDTIIPIFSIIGYPGFRRTELVDKTVKVIFSLAAIYHCETEEDQEYFNNLDFVSMCSIIASRFDNLCMISPIFKLSSTEFIIHAKGTDDIYQLNFDIYQMSVFSYIDKCIFDHVDVNNRDLYTLYTSSKSFNLNFINTKNKIQIMESFAIGSTGVFHITSNTLAIPDAPFLNDIYLGYIEDKRFLNTKHRQFSEIYDVLSNMKDTSIFIHTNPSIRIEAIKRVITEDNQQINENTFTYLWTAFNSDGYYLLYCNHLTFKSIIDVLEDTIDEYFENNKDTIINRIKNRL